MLVCVCMYLYTCVYLCLSLCLSVSSFIINLDPTWLWMTESYTVLLPLFVPTSFPPGPVARLIPPFQTIRNWVQLLSTYPFHQSLHPSSTYSARISLVEQLIQNLSI